MSAQRARTQHNALYALTATLLLLAITLTLVVSGAAALRAGVQDQLIGWLQPSARFTAFLVMALWAGTFAAHYLPRRRQGRPVALVTVGALAVIAILTSLASLIPCTGEGDRVLTPLWNTMILFVGTTPETFTTGQCSGGVPLAVQVARFAALAAVFGTAVAVGLSVAANQVNRVSAKVRSLDELVIGVDEMSLPLLRTLIEWSSEKRKVAALAVEGQDDMARTVRDLGALVMGISTLGADGPNGQAPGGERRGLSDALTPFLVTRGRVGVKRVWVMHPDPLTAVEIAEEAAEILAKASSAKRTEPPRVVVRCDDRRTAAAMRAEWVMRMANRPGATDASAAAPQPVLDSVCAQEVTAVEIVGRIAAAHIGGPNYELVVCGDSALAEAIIAEVATRLWESQDLDLAWEEHVTDRSLACDHKACGPGKHPGGARGDMLVGGRLPDRVVVVSEQAGAMVEQVLASLPAQFRQVLEEGCLSPLTLDWRGFAAAGAAEHSAGGGEQRPDGERDSVEIIVTDRITPEQSHIPARLLGSLGPRGRIWVQPFPPGASSPRSIAPGEESYAENVLLHGTIPEDSWMRVARHLHERYRRQRYEEGKPTRKPWWHSQGDKRVDDNTRNDNLAPLRLLMLKVASLGYEWQRRTDLGAPWVPASWEAEDMAQSEYARWCAAQVRTERSADHPSWPDAPAADHRDTRTTVEGIIRVLCAYGYFPVRREFRRRGTVTASRLSEPVEWKTTIGDVLHGEAGDWWVEGPDGVVRTVTDTEFRGSYEAMAEDRFRRIGTVTARRALVAEDLATLEGPARALPGMWVVTGPNGNIWPVPDDVFREGYEEI